MRITQAYITPCLRKFEQRYWNKYKLQPYLNSNEPALFFGCFSNATMHKLTKHNSTAVVVWAGSDAASLRNKKWASFFQGNKKVFHIAKSEDIENDLRLAGLMYKAVPVNAVNPDLFRPVALGQSIYSYGEVQKPEVYGGALICNIANECSSTSFITANSSSGDFAYSEMANLYSKCFLGLRLTKHDGLSNTVIELGLMGRRCVHNNSKLPNAIPWKTHSDIVQAIQIEQQKIGTTDYVIADKMNAFLKISDNWLQTDFYL